MLTILLLFFDIIEHNYVIIIGNPIGKSRMIKFLICMMNLLVQFLSGKKQKVLIW